MRATFTPNAAEGFSLPCRICGRSAPRGAKLCDQCHAAVQRARQTPDVVSEHLPSTPATTHSLRGVPAARPGSGFRGWLESSMPPGAWGACAAIVAFGTAMALTGYFAVKEIGEEAESTAIVALDPPSASKPDALPLPPAIADESPEYAAPAAPPAAQAEGSSVAGAANRATAAPRRSVGAADSKVRKPKRGGVGTQVASAPAGYSVATTADESPGEAAAAATVASTGSEAMVPDRWQAMHAALAGCSRQNFLAGVVCDERTRWQYCVGYWGKVPECPAAAQVGSTAR